MPCCAVIGCQNYHPKSRGNVTYHRFPVDEELRKKWLKACGRDELFDCSSSRVCSIHFCEDDFERDLQGELLGLPLKRRLKKGVIPHLHIINIKEEPIDEGYNEQSTLPMLHDKYLKIEFVESNETTSESELDSSNLNEDIAANETTTTNVITVEQLGLLSATIQMPTSASEENEMPSCLPACQNWPGEYGFDISFGPQEKNTKGVSWTYSKVKDKLYVGKDAPCPINFSANTVMPKGVVIRAVALYSSPEQASDVVHRCVNHSMDELRRGLFEAEHLIRCESKQAAYHIDKTTKRHSVVVPFENPPVGQLYSTYIYKFVCFGSCSGGPNRRPLMVVFTLEKGNEILGRRKLDLKICACPGRDRKTEELQCAESEERVSQKRKEHELDHDFCKPMSYPFPKKPKTKKEGGGGGGILVVEDPECLEFLKQMKLYYQFYKFMNSLSPDMKKAFTAFQKMKEDEAD